MQIIGIDEVGRGSLAGPLVVGAVKLLKPIDGLKDSKLLTKHQRNVLAEIINEAAVCELGWVWPDEIDAIGLTSALRLGSIRAIKNLDHTNCQIIIDGNINFLYDLENSSAVIKADQTVSACSAASIVAKVARDTYMNMISSRYKDYDFKTNVGYGTKYHLDKLAVKGPCQIHRASFAPLKFKYI